MFVPADEGSFVAFAVFGNRGDGIGDVTGSALPFSGVPPRVVSTTSRESLLLGDFPSKRSTGQRAPWGAHWFERVFRPIRSHSCRS